MNGGIKKIQQCLFRMAKHQSSVEFRMKRIIARYEGLMVYFSLFFKSFSFLAFQTNKTKKNVAVKIIPPRREDT